MLHAITYAVWLVGQVIAGAIMVANDVFRKNTAIHPIIVEYPLRVTKDWQIAAFSTSITMTPGTLSVGIVTAKNPTQPQTLFVQAVYGANPDEVVAGLAEMEQRLCPEVASIDHGAPGQGPASPSRKAVVSDMSVPQLCDNKQEKPRTGSQSNKEDSSGPSPHKGKDKKKKPGKKSSEHSSHAQDSAERKL